jgi:hypothetical protein
MVGIQEIKHDISIEFVTSSEHHYLVFLIGFSQAFNGIGSHIDTCLYYFAIGEMNIEDLVRTLLLNVIHTVNQSLIQVKYQSLLLM